MARMRQNITGTAMAVPVVFLRVFSALGADTSAARVIDALNLRGREGPVEELNFVEKAIEIPARIA